MQIQARTLPPGASTPPENFARLMVTDEMRTCIQERATVREIGILWPNTQRQHRTLHIQKDVLPYALC